jgi:hypothetical protein
MKQKTGSATNTTGFDPFGSVGSACKESRERFYFLTQTAQMYAN